MRLLSVLTEESQLPYEIIGYLKRFYEEGEDLVARDVKKLLSTLPDEVVADAYNQLSARHHSDGGDVISPQDGWPAAKAADAIHGMGKRLEADTITVMLDALVAVDGPELAAAWNVDPYQRILMGT